MRTAEKGIALIKSFEGLRLKAYRCPAGVLTIGYGHTGKDVSLGMSIVERQAEALLRADLSAFEKEVGRRVTSSISQNQFDALVSFTYNLGGKSLAGSTLLKKINKDPNDKTIMGEFKKWNKAGGVVLAGLVKRRAAEGDLYFY